jgi:hypothetical protein
VSEEGALDRWHEHRNGMGELFGGLASLRDASYRRTIIEQLHGLGYAVNTDRPNADDVENIRNLVDWCLERPGAVGALLDVVEDAEEKSEPFRRTRAFVDRVLPSDHFTLEERDRLVDALTKSMDPPQVRRNAARFLRDSADVPPADADELVRALETLPLPVVPASGRPALHPLLELLLEPDGNRRLADRKQLRNLAGKIAKRMEKGQPQALEQRRRHKKAIRRIGVNQTQPSLVIQLEQDGLDHARYRVRTWFCRTDGTELVAAKPESPYPEDEPIGVADVRSGIGRLVESAVDMLMNTEFLTMTIEFIMPRELLNEPVHTWLVDPDDELSFLGEDHVVIVRDLQRQRRSTSMLKWRQKWELISRTDTVSACPEMWISCDGVPPDDRALRLAYDREAAVTLGITFRPKLNGRSSHLPTALNRGIPVAIWRHVECDGHGPAVPQGECAGARFRTDLTERLADENILELPKYVYEQRKTALYGDGFWRDVVLLWDDPDRIPDRLRLDAP